MLFPSTTLTCCAENHMQKIHFRSAKCMANPQGAKIIWFSLIPGSLTRKNHESVSVIMRVCRGKTRRWSRSENSLACRQHGGQEPRKSPVGSWEMWYYSRASLALKTTLHKVNASETTRKDGEGLRDWGCAKEPFAERPRSGMEVAGSRGMEMAEGSAALGEGGCSHKPCQDIPNSLPHGSLCIVTPKRLIIRADARLILGETEKLSQLLCSIPWGGKIHSTCEITKSLNRNPTIATKKSP